MIRTNEEKFCFFHAQRKLILLVLLLTICGAACRGAPFQVKPRSDVPLDRISRRAASTELELRAELLDEDEIAHLFDGNLLLAGVIPVRIALTNTSSAPLALARLNFRLSDAQQHRYSTIKAKDALTRLVKYYGVRVYNPILYDDMKARFLTHSLLLDESLTAGETRQGLIYFKQEKESPLPVGLQLMLGKDKTVNSDLTVMLN